jgi:bifunctional DNA-binding transcriptional regulator/antitoxin component of YhaV-PrlF toxin-antitoxin module
MKFQIKDKQRRNSDMPLVKIKRFAQVTSPPEARKEFNLNEGDYLNIETNESGPS